MLWTIGSLATGFIAFLVILGWRLRWLRRRSQTKLVRPVEFEGSATAESEMGRRHRVRRFDYDRFYQDLTRNL
jgi:hypothetical protein